MKTASLLLCALLLSTGGCILTSGQITTSFDLGDINVTGANNVEHSNVNLATNKDYNDHKDKLKGLANLAVLGTITNNSSPANAINVEVWITTSQTSYTSASDVMTNGTKLWGPFALAANETKTIDWDTSAGLFTTAGKAVLINEIKGDGAFTVYAIGASGDYKFTIPNAQLVLVLDAGI
jgi:hypothetical protein